MPMKNNAPKLTVGPVSGSILSMMLPMALGILVMIGNGLVDAYFIGQLGYAQLAAVSYAFPVWFVASASYRAFRIRNFEATLLLISGDQLMLGRVPIGAIIPWWVVVIMYVSFVFAMIASKIKNRKVFFISFICTNLLCLFLGFQLGWNTSAPLFLLIPSIQEWIMAVPATAGSRAIMIGIALGIVAQSFRIITGRERSILGD